MCTIVVAHQLVPGFPLIVGHDRDERLDRRWRGPVRLAEAPSVLAPRDLDAGGTWVGVNDDGLVVAVTNRFGGRSSEALPSRGQLALMALRSPSADAAAEAVRAHLRGARYHGFNLVLADARSVWVVSRDLRVEEDRALAPGLHLLTSMHHVDPPEVDALRPGLLTAAAEGAGAFGETLRRVLSSNEPLPSGYPVCKHLGPYGTVCGAVLWLGPAGLTRFELASGPPCRTPFVDVPLKASR